MKMSREKEMKLNQLKSIETKSNQVRSMKSKQCATIETKSDQMKLIQLSRKKIEQNEVRRSVLN